MTVRLQVAAHSDEPGHTDHIDHEQKLLLALSVLTTLTSFVVNLFGMRRLLRGARATARRISEKVARMSAAGSSAPTASLGGRGKQVVPVLHDASSAHDDVLGTKDEASSTADTASPITTFARN